MIEKYEEINESDVVLEKEIMELNPKIFRIKLSGIKEEYLIAIIDNKLENSCCNLCGLRKINKHEIMVDVNGTFFPNCVDFCMELEKEFETLTGIESHTSDRSLIFLEQKSESISVLSSINPTEEIEINFKEIKETVCSVCCCGDLEPEEYMRKGCWTKKENCCPLKLFLNKKLKTHG